MRLDVLEATTLITQSSRLANTITQEVKLRSTRIATSNHFDLCKAWGMQREDSLDTFICHNAANGDRAIDATALLGNEYALVDLNAFLVALNDADMDVEGVADAEFRESILELAGGNAFDKFVLVHNQSLFRRCSPVRLESQCSGVDFLGVSQESCLDDVSESGVGCDCRRSGRLFVVRSTRCWCRHCAIAPWSPESNTSGTAASFHSRGRV